MTMMNTTYWVLREGDDATIAICTNYNAACWIAEHYPEPCKLRVAIVKTGSR